MANGGGDGGGAVFVDSTRGAGFKALHMERRVKIYPIQEHELTTLGMLSTLVTLAASIASGTLGFLLSIWWDVATSTDQVTKDVGTAVIVVCFGVVALCVAGGGWAAWSRRSELQKILSETRSPA